MVVLLRGSTRILQLSEEETGRVPNAELPDHLALKLHAAYKDRLEITFPSLVSSDFLIRSKGYVGQIPLSSDYIVSIQPKTTVTNIFRMLEYTYQLQSFEILAGIGQSDSVVDLFERLAFILAKRILDRVRRGLYRSYSTTQESIAYVRGRILVAPTIRTQALAAHNLVCEYEEHTSDLEENRILLWTLSQLTKSPLHREVVIQAVRQAKRVLGQDVSLVEASAQDCTHRLYNRLNDDYRVLHALCRFFLEHSGPAINIGDYELLPFIVYMPALFQSFVFEWMRSNLPSNFRLTSQYEIPLVPRHYDI